MYNLKIVYEKDLNKLSIKILNELKTSLIVVN